MLKGPAVSESDNLNPWRWKRERAPRSRNTAPTALCSCVEADQLPVMESHQDLRPQAGKNDVEASREIPVLAVLDYAIALLAMQQELSQERRTVTTNTAVDLGPAKLSNEVVKTESAPTLQTQGALEPVKSDDLLKDYEERFFLKQDGYDDP